jgi:hypothetical protein
MLRFLCRALGLLLLAIGFVGLVVDGTRSIANNAVVFSSIGEVAAALFKENYAGFQPAVERIHPVLWDPVMRNLTLVPASILTFVIGAILLWLGQKRRETIGYLARR